MKKNLKLFLTFPGVIFILGLGVADPSYPEDNEWTWMGPYGGKITALAVDPRTPSTLYAGWDFAGYPITFAPYPLFHCCFCS